MKTLLLTLCAMMTACGSQSEVGDFVWDVAASDMGGFRPTGDFVDTRFDGRASNWELVQDIMKSARDHGALRAAMAAPQRIEVQEEVYSSGKRVHAVCITRPPSTKGFGVTYARIIISRRVDSYPVQAKRRIIAHETGHCVWNMPDLYSDEDSDKLMYGYGAPLAGPGVKEWKDAQTQERVDNIIHTFMAERS